MYAHEILCLNIVIMDIERNVVSSKPRAAQMTKSMMNLGLCLSTAEPNIKGSTIRNRCQTPRKNIQSSTVESIRPMRKPVSHLKSSDSDTHRPSKKQFSNPVNTDEHIVDIGSKTARRMYCDPLRRSQIDMSFNQEKNGPIRTIFCEKTSLPSKDINHVFGSRLKSEIDYDLQLPQKPLNFVAPVKLQMSLVTPSALMCAPPPRSTRRMSTNHIANASHKIFFSEVEKPVILQREKDMEAHRKALHAATLENRPVPLSGRVDRNRTSGAMLSAMRME